MKLKTTISEEREINIELPFFRKQDNLSNILKLFAVLDEKTVVTVFNGCGRTAVTVDDTSGSNRDLLEAYQTWLPISEDEFLTLHQTALKSLSLTPVLCEIDREIEQELSQKDDLKNIEFS